MQTPKVSVIITTHNRAGMVMERAIRSVYSQSFKDYEIVVVDDCSTDNTQAVLESQQRIRYYRLDRNMGKSFAFNYGITKSLGQYIVCVDDDNEIFTDFLRETVEAIENHPEYDAITTGRIIEYAGFQDYAPPFKGPGFAAIDWGWLIKREVFDNIHYDPEMRGDEDADFGIQFFREYKAFPIDEPLQVAYAVEEEGSVCFPTKKRLESLTKFFVKNWRAYKAAGPKDLSFLYRFMGRTFYKGGHYVIAIQFFWQAWKTTKTRRMALHLFVALFGYWAYDRLMTLEEMYYSNLRLKNYGI